MNWNLISHPDPCGAPHHMTLVDLKNVKCKNPKSDNSK